MSGVLGHHSALMLYWSGAGDNRANEVNFGMNHAPDAVWIAQPVGLH